MDGKLLNKENGKENDNFFSQKFQRELALSVVFHFEFYQNFYLPTFLSLYFKNILNKLVENYVYYRQKVWEIVYRNEFLVMGYIERSLLLLLYSELLNSSIPENLLVFIYIRLAKKYCRKNFHKLISVFVYHAKKST